MIKDCLAREAVKIKITIDTKEDSFEDIKKAIKMLSSLVGQSPPESRNVFESESMPAGHIFGGILDSNETKSPEPIEEKKKEAEEEIPPVVEYL